MSVGNALVTGGAGFIGSYLVDELLLKGWNVVVLDNLKSGNLAFIENHSGNNEFNFVEADLCNRNSLTGVLEGRTHVFHMAADPVIRGGFTDGQRRLSPFRNNLVATRNLLEEMVDQGVENLVFASSSVVYGEADEIPTPEDYGPLKPISIYGATKLGCEGLITAYSEGFDLNYLIFRFANVVGKRSSHGVIPDFVSRLKRDPENLKILGDGRQRKSYLHVKDCVEAILYSVSKTKDSILNLGTGDTISVERLARVVEEEMGLVDIKHQHTGGKGGWKGDIPVTVLSIREICDLGWKPRKNSEQAVRSVVRALMGSPNL